MLFEITKKSSQQKSYLFGTMHTASNSAYTYYPAAVNALGRVSSFAAEIDFSDPRINELGDLFKIPEGKTLMDYIPGKKFVKMKKQLEKSFNVDLTPFNRLQPIFFINHLLSGIIPKHAEEALDHQLYKDALGKSIEVYGLESIEDQYKIVAQLDMETQIQQLKKLCKRPDKFRKRMIQMDNLYAKGDIKSLYHYGRRSLGNYRKVLLINRNYSMAAKMIDIMKERSLFSGVGVAHLYGKNGMLKILKKEGFKVKMIA